MIDILTPRFRPTWLLNLLSLMLVLASSAMVIFFCRNGPPSRGALGIMIAILLLTPVLMRWERGWMILFVYFPFSSWLRRVYLLYQPGDPMAGNDMLSLLPDSVMLLMAISFLMGLRWRKPEIPVPGERELRIAIVIMLGLCFIEMFNPAMGSLQCGVNGARQFMVWIMLYFITQSVARKREDVLRWVTATMVLGAITGLYGAYQYIFEFPSYDMLWAQLNYVTNQTIGDKMRAFSTFSFTSTFSHYMIIAASAGAVAVRLRTLGMFTRIVSPFYLVCALFGLALTFVRSSYLGMGVALLVGLIIAGRPKGRWKRLILTFAAATALLFAMPSSKGDSASNVTQEDGSYNTSQLVTERALTLTEPGKVGSFSQRLVAWERVLNYSTAFPIGVGLGAGSAYRINFNFVLAAMAYTESQYFSMLAELGYPGAILFLFIVIYGFVYSVSIHDQLTDPDARRLVQMSLMMQASLSIAGITGGTVLYTLPGSAYYWTALGLVTAIARMEGLRVPDKVPAPSIVAVMPRYHTEPDA